MVLESAYEANFRCVLHHLSSLTRSKGPWGQLWPKTDPKEPTTTTKMIMSPRGLIATEFLYLSAPLGTALFYGYPIFEGSRAPKIPPSRSASTYGNNLEVVGWPRGLPWGRGRPKPVQVRAGRISAGF